MNLSLVAFYGEKQSGLSEYLSDLQVLLLQQLGDSFIPYAMNQMHATIAGLEGFIEKGMLYNKNFYNLQNQKRAMKISQALQFLASTDLLPLSIQFGGFVKNKEFGFYSFDQHPWLRSFSFQGDRVVTIGWPYQKSPNPALVTLRRKLEEFGVLHKWHRYAEDSDNDCYIVLGHLRNPSSKQTDGITTSIRNYLGNAPFRTINLSVNNLSLVQYTETSLLPMSTRCLTLNSAIANQQQLQSWLKLSAS